MSQDQEVSEIMSEEYDDSADLEWVPPSEAEQKIINARRERSDKISKLMGQYLLKGYKMLATCCSKCGTIELEDRQNQKYCVACEEVDCQETNKDNPAVNPEAARLQIAESQMLDIDSQIETGTEVVEETVEVRRVSQREANPTLFRHTPSPLRLNRLPTGSVVNRSLLASGSSNPVSLMHSSLDSVFSKMSSATQSLMETDDIEMSTQLVKLIRECADCALSLKKASIAHQ